MKTQQTVFLGGTCGQNTWRDGLIARLTARGVSVELLFNPVVKDWDEEKQKRDRHHYTFLCKTSRNPGGPKKALMVPVPNYLPSAVFRNEFRYVTTGEIFGSSINAIIQARYQQAQSYNASISAGSSDSRSGGSSLPGTHWITPSGAVVSWGGR